MGRETWLGLLGCTVAIGAFLFTAAVDVREPRRNALDAFFVAIPIGMLPLLAYNVYIFGLRVAVGTRNIHGFWEGHSALHGPRDLEINDDAVEIRTSHLMEQCQWDLFSGFLETPNTLLLYIGTSSFHIIPKRIFVEAGELDLFCGLLQSRVREGKFLSRESRFPIVPSVVTPAEVSSSQGDVSA